MASSILVVSLSLKLLWIFPVSIHGCYSQLVKIPSPAFPLAILKPGRWAKTIGLNSTLIIQKLVVILMKSFNNPIRNPD